MATSPSKAGKAPPHDGTPRSHLARREVGLHRVHAHFSLLDGLLAIETGVFPDLGRGMPTCRGRLRRDGGLPFVSGAPELVP